MSESWMNKKVKYIGGCDVLRQESYKWAQFNNELVEGNEYECYGELCVQGGLKNDENDITVFTNAPERYRYLKVIGENKQRVMVWDDCFTFNGVKDTW